jgi:hypothetical protein
LLMPILRRPSEKPPAFIGTTLSFLAAGAPGAVG